MKKEARRVTIRAPINKSPNNLNQESIQTPKHSHAGLILTIIVLAFAFMICFFMLVSRSQTSNANIAVIPINGMILSGSTNYYDGNTYSDDVSSITNNIIENKNIKAVIFEINSPGGSAVGSSEVADSIKKLRDSGKLTIALIREQGTSGAYWIATACDKIYTNPLAITGSIGVLASYLEYGDLLERFNITYERLNAGQYKDTMSPYRELTDEERTILKSKINLIYEAFIRAVAENRNLSEANVKELATGIFYLGSEAKQLGLIDELGSKQDAISYIEQQLNIKSRVKDYSTNSFLSGLYGLQDRSFYMIGKGLGASIFNQNNLNIQA
jgi:protease-4